MKGDVTRETFRPDRHYWGVLRQQGRVDIDADWNEQVRIARYQEITRTADLIGPSGGPINGAGFGLTVDEAGVVRIGAGRYYVAGMLCENEAPVVLTAQPDPPAESPPSSPGLHLAFLDVWDRHVTALDDPHIREVALGGPDTATRARTVWQVRTQSLLASNAAVTAAIAALAAAQAASNADDEAVALQDLRELVTAASCATPLDPVDGSIAPGTGTMAARAREGTAAADLCRFDPGGGGYTLLQNRLYRVEIHDPGNDVAATAATYKWSRDNGAIAVSVEEFRNTGSATTTKEIVVRRLGLDSSQELNQDDWIEIVSDDLIARGKPGQLVQIANKPDPADRIVILSDPVQIKDMRLHPQVRRWDFAAGVPASVRKTWEELEAGIEVRFGAGNYHTGDYWVIPARAITADVEWPPFPEYPGHVPGPPDQVPPRGIAHWRAPIAALVRDATRVVAAIDLRPLFPAATDLVDFAYAGGDGQVPELPSGRVPQPLQAAVTNGSGPVAGVMVEFEVVAGASALTGNAQTATTVVVPTNADGLASVDWTVAPAAVDHRVRARLLDDDCATPTHAPIFYSARVNYQLHYLAGDGQEAMPGKAVSPLRAWVSDGRWPVAGARVRFTVTQGSGTVVSPGPTGPDGIAECPWTLDAVTPRQQVTAELLDAAGTRIHQAALTFTANLSLASKVSYTPVADCFDLSSATTVQEALDELCKREGGGDCTYTIRAGDDLVARFAEIDASTFRDGAICFAEGLWRIDKPLVLTGKGHVTIRGLGRASAVTAERGETVLRLEGCESVAVTDIALVATAASGGDGLGGALSVVDCGAVTIERLTVVAPGAPEPRVSGIAVTRGERVTARGPIRIHDCDVATGEQQTGILVVNGDVVQIEGNALQASAFSEGTKLADYLTNARYRAAARRQLVDPRPRVRLEAAPDVPTAPETGLVVNVDVGAEGEEVAFRSTMRSASVWTSLLEDARTGREALTSAHRIADTVLRNEGALAGRRVFQTWFQEIEARWEAAGERGIVVAGRRAEDVRVVGNVISGHLQGISVALSADTRQVYRAGVAVIEGNTVRLPAWSLVRMKTEGILLGNTESAIVDGNTVIVGDGRYARDGLAVDGIRAGGVMGPRLLIRSNHLGGTVVGIRVEPIRPITRVKRWVASDNVATIGVCLEAPCEVMEDANVPARSESCPIDRPI